MFNQCQKKESNLQTRKGTWGVVWVIKQWWRPPDEYLLYLNLISLNVVCNKHSRCSVFDTKLLSFCCLFLPPLMFPHIKKQFPARTDHWEEAKACNIMELIDPLHLVAEYHHLVARSRGSRRAYKRKTQPPLQLLFILWYELAVRWCPSMYPQL